MFGAARSATAGQGLYHPPPPPRGLWAVVTLLPPVGSEGLGPFLQAHLRPFPFCPTQGPLPAPMVALLALC